MNRAELEAVRAKIAQGWTQGVAARDANGLECPPTAKRAANFCLVGACIAGDVFSGDLRKALRISSISLAEWNDADGRTQADVLARIDTALAEPQPSGRDVKEVRR